MQPNLSLPPSIVAALLGHSPRHIRHLVAEGILPAEQTGTWARIPLAAIEAYRGREISGTEFMEAVEQVERTRGYYRAYQARRRNQPRGPALSP